MSFLYQLYHLEFFLAFLDKEPAVFKHRGSYVHPGIAYFDSAYSQAALFDGSETFAVALTRPSSFIRLTTPMPSPSQRERSI